jgi:hypothetical protein
MTPADERCAEIDGDGEAVGRDMTRVYHSQAAGDNSR